MSSLLHSYNGTKIRVPDYTKKSIAQLPPFFKDVLLGKATGPLAEGVIANNIALDNIKNIVFFLVDGFGAQQWQEYSTKLKALQKFENNGCVDKLDSVFPASTPGALTTLHTNGLTPRSHGVIDWWLYVEEIDKIVATLPFAEMGSSERDSLLNAGVKPSILFNGKTTYEDYAQEGIKSRAFVLQDYANSAYTQTVNRGSEIVPHNDIDELFSTLNERLNEPQQQSTFNFVYWGGVDAAGHTYGLGSNEYEIAARHYFEALDTFLNLSHARDTLFVISADHGQIQVDPRQTIYLDTIDGLSDLFRAGDNGQPILPWGGPREVFLAVRDDSQEEALALLHQSIGEHAELLRSREALEAGLFGQSGKLHPHISSRIGDVIVLPKANKTVWYHHGGQKPFDMKGHHGGLSETELKVPFGVLRQQ